MSWQEIGDRVYRRRYESLDLNVGLVLGDGAALVIDTRATYGQADELKAEIASLTAAPVTTAVNTHHHWDHTFGNARFAGADLVGHARCASQLVATGPAMKAQLKEMVTPVNHDQVDAIVITPPTTLFEETMKLNVGGRDVDLHYFGRAHTDNDIIVRVDDVVFAGDIIEESAPPYFGDSFPLEWPHTLARSLIGSVYVPGHGDVMTIGAVHDQLEELGEVARKAEACAESGDPINEGPFPLAVMQMALERTRATR